MMDGERGVRRENSGGWMDECLIDTKLDDGYSWEREDGRELNLKDLSIKLNFA
jgi:hypothetical protein